MFRKIAISLAALAAAFTAVVTNAQPARAAWPDRPLTIIVPWGAGGAADQLSRALSPMLEKDLSVPVNVVLRPGGSGAVGHTAIAQAAPDGYTWGLAHRRDHHDALAGARADPAERFHNRLDHQRRCRRADRAHGIAVQEREGIARRHQGETGRHLQSLRHRPGRHLASRPCRLAACRKGRSEESAVGAEPGRRSRRCRISSRAASISSPHRCPRAAR